jgi:hypothetical protein
MSGLWGRGKGMAAPDHNKCQFVRFAARIRDFPHARKKEKIPVDNGTYMEQSENITSKGEPDD